MIKLFGFKTKSPVTQEWGIDEDFKDNLSIDVLIQINDEGVKRFDSIIDDISNLKTKGYTLLTVFISLLGIITSFYFNDRLFIFCNNEIILSILFALDMIILTYCIIQLVVIITPNLLKVKGEEPIDINYSGMSQLSKEDQKKIYLFNSISVIQEKISFNEIIIKDRVERLESVIVISTITFIITLILTILLK